MTVVTYDTYDEALKVAVEMDEDVTVSGCMVNRKVQIWKYFVVPRDIPDRAMWEISADLIFDGQLDDYQKAVWVEKMMAPIT